MLEVTKGCAIMKDSEWSVSTAQSILDDTGSLLVF